MKVVYSLLIKLLLIVITGFVFTPVYSQVALVEWNFPNNPDDAVADGGVALNSTKTISIVGGPAIAFSLIGATTNSAHATGWTSGNGTKWWEIEVTTTGYQNITLSSKQRSSNTGPRDWKVQYKIGASGTWTDAGYSITVADNFTAGVLNTVTLPIIVNNESSVFIRWIMNSDIAVGGAAVGGTGSSRIDDIVLQGTLIPGSNSVSTNAVTGSPFCITPTTGANVNVPFTSTGTFNAGNIYTAQLSDASGNFASPLSIGTLSSTANSGTIAALIPAGTAAGTGYRIRVVSSDPAVTGTDNGADLSVLFTPNVSNPAADPGNGEAFVSWVNPSGCFDEVLIVAQAGSSIAGTPTGDGTAYTANTSYGSGTPFGSGFVVYKGTTSPQTLTGLTNNTQYYFKIFSRRGSNWSSGVEVSTTPGVNPFALLDDFNRANNNTVGTHNLGGTWTEFETVSPGSVRIESNRLAMGSTTNPRDYVSTNVSAHYSTQYSLATSELVWVFNMRTNRTDLSGFGTISYGMAVVLGSNQANFDAAAGFGYAVVFGNTGSPDPIRLVSFNNGLNVNSNLSSDIIAASVPAAINRYFSVKVTFNPSTNQWRLYVRDDGTTNFADPTTITSANLEGTATNSTYVTDDLPYVGALWNHNTAASDFALFDNFYIPTAVTGVTTYVFNTASGSWAVPANWTPTRTTPLPTDILVFNNDAIVTGLPTETIAQLRVENNADVTLRPTATSTLNITGGTGIDLIVEAGSSLAFHSTGNQDFMLNLASGATAEISGTIRFYSTGNLVQHSFISPTVGAIVVKNGANFIQGPSVSGNMFGNTGPQNIAVFESGSTFTCRSGANPFGLSQPNSKVDFQLGSFFRHETATLPTLAGRTYPHFIIDAPTLNTPVNTGSSTAPFTFFQSLTILDGNFRINLGSNNNPINIVIEEDLIVQPGAMFEFNPTNSPAASYLRLGGSAAQTVGGGGTILFGRYATVEIENNVSLSSMVDVFGGLLLKSGTLTTNNNLRIRSNATATGYVLPQGGTLTGTATVERHLETTEYHHISAPVNPAPFSEINDDVTLIGIGGIQYDPATPINPFPNIWKYEETVTDPDSMRGWFTPSSLTTEVMVQGRGYSLYAPNNTVLDYTGVLNNGSVNQTVSNTVTSPPNPPAQGWNLVGNPYASPIDWELLTLPAAIDNAIYFWDPVSRQYASYVSGVGTNGGSKDIASGQGFFIKVNTPGASTNLTFTNSVRTAGNPEHFKNTPQQMLKLKLTGAGFADETVIRFAAGATENYDGIMDAFKKKSTTPNVPSLYTTGDIIYSVNTLPEITASVTVPMALEVKKSGAYMITASDFDHIDASVIITLEDLKTNTIHNIRTAGAYNFTAAAGDLAERFLIHFSSPVEVKFAGMSCSNEPGILTLEQTGGVIWDVEVKDSGNQVVANFVFNGSSTLTGLNAGSYDVELTSGSYSVSYPVLINAAQSVSAAFAVSAIKVEAGKPVTFVNMSQGHQACLWEFGDGTMSAATGNAKHTYNTPGNYIVKLISSNADCADEHQVEVQVRKPSATVGEVYQGNLNVFSDGGKVIIAFDEPLTGGSLQVDIYDMIGKLVHHGFYNGNKKRIEVRIDKPSDGMYLVRVSGSKETMVRQVFIAR